MGELPVEHREPALLIEQRIAGAGIAVDDDAGPGGLEICAQPRSPLLDERDSCGRVRSVEPEPAVDVVADHLLGGSFGRVDRGHGHPMEFGDRSDDVVEPGIIEAHLARDLLHDEEGLAEHGASRLDVQDRGHPVSRREQSAHRGDLGHRVGAEHAALLAANDHIAAVAIQHDGRSPHPPGEPSPDHLGLQDLNGGSLLSGEPGSEPGELGLVDLDHRVLDIGAVAGEHAQERLGYRGVLARPGHEMITQLRRPWVIEHRLSRSVEGRVSWAANELGDDRGAGRSRILAAG
ncbi:unannotated protein [freshwater metagenome]|uniref:Unannotated protein n=1 Tax=freshwater metagenome TaxID=449393 RepID=A0A6J6UR87_9ZZZZ